MSDAEPGLNLAYGAARDRLYRDPFAIGARCRVKLKTTSYPSAKDFVSKSQSESIKPDRSRKNDKERIKSVPDTARRRKPFMPSIQRMAYLETVAEEPLEHRQAHTETAEEPADLWPEMDDGYRQHQGGTWELSFEGAEDSEEGVVREDDAADTGLFGLFDSVVSKLSDSILHASPAVSREVSAAWLYRGLQSLEEDRNEEKSSTSLLHTPPALNQEVSAAWLYRGLQSLEEVRREEEDLD
eukprot:TRINITY_DN546_c0_g1_i3.p1 TRINITY_DN546_c0_g1~~TRINITY_DN546_c0_g1_i3.p1  ORF type:complete len:241 (+),score=43.90 TRINITY_DN546_c0_g1_i3:43-765(+)